MRFWEETLKTIILIQAVSAYLSMGVVLPKLLEYKAMELGKVWLKSTDLRTSAQKGVGGSQCINSLNRTILDSKLRLKYDWYVFKNGNYPCNARSTWYSIQQNMRSFLISKVPNYHLYNDGKIVIFGTKIFCLLSLINV